MSAHTPGPWIAAAGPSSVVGWPVVSSAGRSICRLTWRATASPAEEVCKEETRANARLIAAAPDLLAALRMMLANCPTCGGSGTMYLHDDEASCGMTPGTSARPCSDCSEARAAIAKAEGAIKEIDQ